MVVSELIDILQNHDSTEKVFIHPTYKDDEEDDLNKYKITHICEIDNDVIIFVDCDNKILV